MTAKTEHVNWNDLAALAERGRDHVDAAVLAHLAGCGDCLAAYGEAVRCHDARLAGAAADSRTPVPAPVRLVPRRQRWGKVAWSTGSLAAAAVLLILLMPRDPGSFGPDDPRSALQSRLVEMSADGPLLPGVEQLTGGEGPRYRAGTDAAVGDLGELLTPWARRFGSDPADTEAAFWLSAGYLASGRLNYADDVLRRALQRHPQAVGLQHLDAVTAYRLNELDRAEAALRRILAARPTDGTARFNLALIEVETQRVEQARLVLTELAADADQPAVQARARQLLDLIGD